MTGAGYVYVLANSAMPGFAKVGKTTRSPEMRAVELSTATGLPTPFIVVYEQYFEDCSIAERYIHSYLEKKGFRVNENREFFNAPISEIVRAISMAPGSKDNNSIDDFSTVSTTVSGSAANDVSAVKSRDQLIERVIEEAINFQQGTEECIQDSYEAIRLYRQAIDLGSFSAYIYLAELFSEGDGVPKNAGKAIEILREGTRKGSLQCTWKLGMAVFDSSNGRHTAIQCFKKVFARAEGQSSAGKITDINGESFDIVSDCASLLIRHSIRRDLSLPHDLVDVVEDVVVKNASQLKELVEIYKVLGAGGAAGRFAYDLTRLLKSIGSRHPV